MKTMKEMQDHVVFKASFDDEFRASLLKDPRGSIEKELGVKIPGNFSVEVHEDNLTTAHLVLPVTTGPEAMSEDELAAVVGGAGAENCEWGHDHHDEYHVPLGGP